MKKHLFNYLQTIDNIGITPRLEVQSDYLSGVVFRSSSLRLSLSEKAAILLVLSDKRVEGMELVCAVLIVGSSSGALLPGSDTSGDCCINRLRLTALCSFNRALNDLEACTLEESNPRLFGSDCTSTALSPLPTTRELEVPNL